jgi:hypothetical protein
MEALNQEEKAALVTLVETVFEAALPSLVQAIQESNSRDYRKETWIAAYNSSQGSPHCAAVSVIEFDRFFGTAPAILEQTTGKCPKSVIITQEGHGESDYVILAEKELKMHVELQAGRDQAQKDYQESLNSDGPSIAIVKSTFPQH